MEFSCTVRPTRRHGLRAGRALQSFHADVSTITFANSASDDLRVIGDGKVLWQSKEMRPEGHTVVQRVREG